MKLEMSLPERPGFLHAVPIVNLFALMQLFFLLGPSLILQSGVAVELPPSRFQMERFENSIVVTLRGGDGEAVIYLGREEVTLDGLAERLEKLRETAAQRTSLVLLKTDQSTAVGAEREVTELVLRKGFRLALVGKTALGSERAAAPISR
jgi:biopolymer transport protein ExbD